MVRKCALHNGPSCKKPWHSKCSGKSRKRPCDICKGIADLAPPSSPLSTEKSRTRPIHGTRTSMLHSAENSPWQQQQQKAVTRSPHPPHCSSLTLASTKQVEKNKIIFYWRGNCASVRHGRQEYNWLSVEYTRLRKVETNVFKAKEQVSYKMRKKEKKINK